MRYQVFIVGVFTFFLEAASVLAEEPIPIVKVLNYTTGGFSDVSDIGSGRYGLPSTALGSAAQPIPYPQYNSTYMLIGDRTNPQFQPGSSEVNGLQPQTTFPGDNEVGILCTGCNGPDPSLVVLGSTLPLNVPRKVVAKVTIGIDDPNKATAIQTRIVELWFMKTSSTSGGGGGGGGTTNRAPQVSAGANQTVRYGQSVTLNGTATDEDGDTLTFSWRQLNTTGGNAVVLAGSTTKNPTFIAPSRDDTLTFEFTVSDGKTSSNATTKVFVTREGSVVTPPDELVILCSSQSGNQAAIANAGTDKIFNGGETVTIVGSGLDPDNTQTYTNNGILLKSLSYLWEVIDSKGLTITLQNATTNTVTFVAPQVSQDTTIVLSLTVKDVLGCGSRDQVRVTIRSTNRVPQANAGEDQIVYRGQTVTLSGKGTDPDGDTLSYAWVQISGSPNVSLIGANKAAASFVAPEVAVETQLAFRLTVTDSKGASHTDEVKISIRPRTESFFAQVVDGGGVITTFSIWSQGAAVNGTLKFYKKDGTPLSLTVNGTNNSVFPVSIPTLGSVYLTTGNSSANPVQGWAFFESDSPVQSLATYDVRNGGKLFSSVTVFGSQGVKKVTLPLETNVPLDINTGIAVANIDTVPIKLRLRLVSEAGVEEMAVQLPTLAPNTQMAALATELFGGVDLIKNFKGRVVVEIVGDGKFAATGVSLREGLLRAIPTVGTE
ncbi:MAG: hypothetical protein HY645_12970 [Acidobacteria bacterium]|nr:hypothetical protein [Acidobacteriota bacterium]